MRKHPIETQDHDQRRELSLCRTLRRGGCGPVGKQLPHEVHERARIPISSSTGHSESEPMGRKCDSIGQECWQDIHRSVQRGQGLSASNSQSTSSGSLVEKFSTLRDSHGEAPSTEQIHAASIEQPGADEQSPDANSSPQESEQPGDQSGSRECDRTVGDDPTESKSPGETHIWTDDHQGGRTTNEPGAQSSPCSRTSNSDRSPSARVGARDQGPGPGSMSEASGVLSESQSRVLIQKIDQYVHVIEDGLSRLKQHPTLLTKRNQFRGRPVDLLEIYCHPQSQITHQINRAGGNAIRFTKKDGDLSTEEGKNKLWSWILMYEPRHVWASPECKLWGSFSRFNMGRNPTLHDRISTARKLDLQHLHLCNQIYLHQISKGNHFHLEQPRGSDMLKQPQLDDVVTGTLPAFFDMCQAGKLRDPNHDKYIKKSTQVLTTSRHMHTILHNQNCPQTHEHQQIKGQMKTKEGWTQISAYAAAYTAIFGRRVKHGVLRDLEKPQHPILMEELLVGESIENQNNSRKRPLAQEVLELRTSRRRHSEKGPPTAEDRAELGDFEMAENPDAPGSDFREPVTPQQWKELFQKLEVNVPRVGVHNIPREDSRLQEIQPLVPEFQVRHAMLCRGTERYMIPKRDTVYCDDLEFRKTVLVDRQSGEIKDLGSPEKWQNLSKVKQQRKAGPARLSLAIFGAPWDSEMPEAKSPDPSPKPDLSVQRSDESLSEVKPPEQDRPLEPFSSAPDEGWAPKIVPKHGPHFLSLSSQQKEDLRRLHHNLGHPDPARLKRLLESQGASEEVIQGALDMQCDVCVETQGRLKLPAPGKIHNDHDFNDVVGADGAHWKASNGQTYHFMHFIDESTLFHLGDVSGRTVPEQISTFENVWLHWAGPCKTLYLDPAGEYVSPAWNDHLQRHNVRTVMAAGDSHWQIGRSEIHGRIVKDMLTRMDREQPILDLQEFRRCLREVFMAKNSLSRAKGFTPEQALLGKARSLPGSLTADEQSGAHLLAESESPEGLRFRESLQRREQARKAFVMADNDSACRRALLRRSRPGAVEFSQGDWVLYWKRNRGNIRAERGRWHGPAQVITVEQHRVIWLSHGGYLIRASPQHLRPASLREYRALPRDTDGRVRDERIDPKTKNYVALDDTPSEDSFSYAPSIAPSNPDMPQDGSQPEQEISPSPSMEHEPQNDQIGNPDDGVVVPVPVDSDLDSVDDELVCFGDDCWQNVSEPGIWEIELTDEYFHEETNDISAQFAECILLATSAKKQRVEVQWRTLNDHDRQLFSKAKDKEIGAWIDHQTVKKVAKGTLPAHRIMRCRWILTWKSPAPGTTEKRAKARLVILGFEDPDISVVPNDAPTLSKDGKQLVLQQVASHRWTLLNFDVSTAFLKGQGDGRPLGIHPPPELAEKLKLGSEDQCSLVGGAYGRIDAPYLWYQAFRATLEELGFLVCPLDNCVFSLVTMDQNNSPRVRGVLGIHVDDGIGGGDEYFMSIIEKLRGKYTFGAFNTGEFEFCGIHYRQWDDYSIEMCQQEYIQKIDPIHIPRPRRQEPESSVSEVERQQLRQLCGSMQYAATQTRPDICAKVGILQSRIPKAKISDLIEANRVLFEAKTHPVSLMVVPIKPSQVAFCAFSDASFETKKGDPSRQGTIIFTTDAGMAKNQLSVICPIAWSSRKIPRVVRSTLSAEASALSSTLDRVSWLRVMWAWLCDPGVDWTNPNEILSQTPLATIATDCKSVFDISTKTSTPSCEEFRTTLECLLIRERLSENCKLRWVSSQAMLADCLTKTMEGSMLRKALALGKYSMFDELDILKQRADKRERLKWLAAQEAQVKDP